MKWKTKASARRGPRWRHGSTKITSGCEPPRIASRVWPARPAAGSASSEVAVGTGRSPARWDTFRPTPTTTAWPRPAATVPGRRPARGRPAERELRLALFELLPPEEPAVQPEDEEALVD